jgi:VWFA-related protein
VQKAQDFTSVENDKLAAGMDKVRKKATGRMGGVPVGGMGGPLNSSGPQINGRPLDPGQKTNPASTQAESKVLNDAILEAAMDLARREPTRRKVLFVISDGREYNSSASYREVLKVLLSHQVTVYAIGVGSAAIPGYSTAQKLRIPGFGYGDILPKYAGATGGQVFTEFSQDAIEQAYSRVTEEARNQYTIGYTTRATPSSAYREIEVLVERPDCKKHSVPNCVNVAAREGYFPLPPGSR